MKNLTQDERYNSTLLVTDGILYYASRALFDYNVLVPAFVSYLGASPFLVGLASSINRLGFYFPQVFVANYAAVRPLNKPILLLGVKVYTFALFALIPPMLLLAGRAPGAALALFFILYSISCAGDGVQALPWVDILAKAIQSTKRGRLLGYMQTLAGIASFGMAALVAWVLGRAWLAFPVNYMLLVFLSALLGLCSVKVLGFLREPVREISEKRESLSRYLRSIPAVIQANPGYNRFLLVRVLSQSYSLAAPFYVTFAIDVLGAPKSLMGGFIAAQMAGVMVGGVLLGYVGDLAGNSWSVRLSLAASLMSPLAALFVGYGLANGRLGGMAVFFLLVLYFFLGAAVAGLWMTLQNYLLELVHPDNRATCVGLANIFIAPMSFLPVMGGFLLGFIEYRGLFSLTFLLVLAAFGFSLGLSEPRRTGASGPGREDRELLPGKSLPN